jgi:Flp pilus assembly protein CpaB
VTAVADLAAGTVLAAGDLSVADVPAALVPEGTVSPGEAAGRVLAAPLRRGEVVTDARLVGRGLLTGQPAGTVALAVRPSDPAVTALVRAGDRVRVLAGPDPADPQTYADGGAASVLVPSATVLAVPPGSGEGLFVDQGSAVLLLAVQSREALALATSGEGRWLSVALLPG